MNIQKTRCPHCSSIFTVSDTQLSIRDGYTRCGKCFKVFKADDYLLVEPQVANPSTPTLFDDVARVPAQIHIMATKEARIDPTHIADLKSLDTSKPEPEEVKAPASADEINAAENKLASTLSDQPLATLARMLANELSMLSPQPLLPVAAVAAPAAEPAASPSPVATSEPELPDVALANEHTPTTDDEAPAAESTAPVMSHIFEQEFNDLWLSATDHSKPLASAVASSAAAEKKRETLLSKESLAKEALANESLVIGLDDGLTEHFNSIESDSDPLVTTAVPKQAELSDAMIQQPSIAALRAAADEEPHDDEEDLFSYLNKNNVAAAPASLRPKRILPGMQPAIDPKAANKTGSRSALAPHPRQPSSKRTALPPIKRPNLVMERLTKPMPFFNFSITKALGWGFLSLIMLGLLGVQYVYFNFDSLAANPAYSPALKQMCEYAGCEVPMVDVHKIKISNKLARRYSESPNEATRFSATMLNRAETSQPYPPIQVLILKHGVVQSGRIVKPSEYIQNGYTTLAKIPANTPVQIHFVLKIPRDQIAVFALDPI